MNNKANPRFFYYMPEDINIINFWISPGHYGRSISSILGSARILISEIPHTVWLNLEKFVSTDGNVEIGNTNWDKYVVRVHFQVKIKNNSKTARFTMEELLKRNGFSIIPEDFKRF